MHYAKTWLFVDFMSAFPFDRVLPLLEEETFKDNASIRMVKLLRSARLFRLLKTLKVLRLDHKFGRITEFEEFISPSLSRLVKLLFRILFVAHLLACFWFFVNACEADETGQDELIWTKCGSNNLPSQYIASFYWTIATMMAVGYGDIYAESDSERAYAIATQVIGAVAFGFIIATVTIIIETMDPEATAKKRKREELFDYLKERGYSRDLQKRAKEHFNYFQAKTSAFAEMRIVGDFSDSLKEVIIFESRNKVIPKIRMFSLGVSDQFIAECLLRLKPMILAYHQSFGSKGDISEEVYFVAKGRIEGLDMVANSTSPRSPSPVVAHPEVSSAGDDKKSGEESRSDVKPVIALIVTDGYDFELANCLCEKPMDLRYRASSVTDVLWLDHESLVFLKNCFVRSVSALHGHVNRYDRMLGSALLSPIRSISDGVYVHEKVIHNSSLVDFNEVKQGILKGIRYPQQKQLQQLTSEDAILKLEASQQANSRHSFSAKARDMPGSSSALTETLSDAEVLLRVWKFDAAKGGMVETEESQQELAKRWLLNPNSPVKLKWDVYIGLLIIVSVVIVPLRLGFDIDLTVEWLVFDWIIDFFFAMDIFINFRTGFLDEQQILHTSSPVISKHYMRGWLFIDLVSTIPFDKIVSAFLSSDNDPSSLRSLRLVRIVRLVRLAKLIKLLKQQGQRDISNGVLNIDPVFVQIAKLLFTLIFIGHLFGCFFSYITLESVAEYGSVLNHTNAMAQGMLPHELPYNSEIPWNGVPAWWVKLDHEESNLSSRYLASLYWAFTTMTTVGYGDVVPTTDLERVYASLIMILGATVFGYIVGSVSGLASNPHGALARANENNLLLSNYLEEQNVKPTLRRLAKEQVKFNRNFVSVFDEPRILANFPIGIRREMIVEAHAMTIKKIAIFNSGDVSLITNVMHYLKPAFFGADQYIYRSSDEGVRALMFLLSGIAEEVPDRNFGASLSGLKSPMSGKLYCRESFNSQSEAEEEGGGGDSESDRSHGIGLDRKIIEAGKCFGYQSFVADGASDVEKPSIAYRAFVACSVMLLTEYALKAIIERHPVLREKLRKSLEEAILKQTATVDRLSRQVETLKKKKERTNSLFSSLHTAVNVAKEKEEKKALEEVTESDHESGKVESVRQENSKKNIDEKE